MASYGNESSETDDDCDGKPWLRATSPAPVALQTTSETPTTTETATPPTSALIPPSSSETPPTNQEIIEPKELEKKNSSWLLVSEAKAEDQMVPGLTLTPTDSSGSTNPIIVIDGHDEGAKLNVSAPRPTITVTGADSAATRGANTEVVLVVGDATEKTPSTIKMERIKEQLSTDSRGNVLQSMPMSDAGRYRSRKSVVGTGMFHVDERAKQNAIRLRMKKMLEPEPGSEEEFDIETLQDDPGMEDDTFTDMENDTGNLRRTVDEEFAKMSTENEVTDEDAEAGVQVLPAVTLDPKNMKTADAGAKGISFATIVNLKRMRNRIGKGVVTTKTFAKDKKHEELLKEHARKTAIELPLPLKMAINEEATQVVQGTVKAYMKILGKKHPLTVGAVNVLANLKKKGDEYAQI